MSRVRDMVVSVVAFGLAWATLSISIIVLWRFIAWDWTDPLALPDRAAITVALIFCLIDVTRGAPK